MKPKRTPEIAFVVTNCICNDNRVRKMASVARQMGAEVTIIGRKTKNCKEETIPGFRLIRFHMLFRRGFLFYAFFNIRTFFSLLFLKASLLVANDLDTLLPSYLVSRIRHIRLIYDSHEYFTGVPELQDKPFIRSFWKRIESYVFPRLSNILTVSDSIAEQYLSEYGIRPITVRNCAEGSSHIEKFSREELGISTDQLLIILQGTGINLERGGEELIDAVMITERVTLLVIGSGDKLPMLKKKVSDYNICDRVKFIPVLPWTEMMRYTRSADAGISPDKNVSINSRFSLPNKLFDYISAAIPVIAGPLPEVERIISENNCGIIVPEISARALSEALIRLRDSSELLNDLKQNAKAASENLLWEKESLKVSGLYAVLI
jgi:glycosyltransferase involved in cell wall biosynthesis